MKLSIGDNTFANVKIPLLWGKRAIIQDEQGRLSVIDLSDARARLEILGDRPAPDIEYLPTDGGFEILRDGEPLYRYDASEKLIMSVGLGNLPDCQIRPDGVRIGGSHISRASISGFEIGIMVDENLFAMGAPMPPGLAELKI